VQLARRPDSAEPRAAIEFPATTVEPVTASPIVSDAPATDRPPTGMSSLQVDLFSYLAKGVVTIYSNEDQVLLQPFRFGRREGLAGLIRRKKSAGRLEKTLTLPAGTSEFRIYVSADGIETQTVNLTATLRDAESHVLRLIIAENGSASAQID